jgi:hypothetical protein
MTRLILLGWCPAAAPWTLLTVFPLVLLCLSIVQQKLMLSTCLVFMPRYFASVTASETALITYHLRLRVCKNESVRLEIMANAFNRGRSTDLRRSGSAPNGKTHRHVYMPYIQVYLLASAAVAWYRN